MEITVDEARELLASVAPSIADIEGVSLAEALGRVLASDVQSTIDVPPFDNSAMDGYALAPPYASPARIIGASQAGKPFAGTVGKGECVRILTGAAIPDGADAVIAQERTTRTGDAIAFEATVERGLNIRKAGEDLTRGSIVLRKWRVLRPADIGAIASIGLRSCGVIRKPRVGIFTTGDELVSSGALGKGQLYDSNGALLHALVVRALGEPVDLGHANDDEEELRAKVKSASACDFIVSTGGVAVGDTDCIPRALGATSIEVAMKPGRHLAYAKLGRAAYVGLPGNPVAVIATFDALIAPLIRRSMGANERERIIVRAKLTSAVKNKQARLDFQRGILVRQSDGSFAVASTGHQGAGILRSVLEANCFILVPPSAGEISAGSWVDVELFQGLERL